MIHNSFRRIARAQGLLPGRVDPRPSSHSPATAAEPGRNAEALRARMGGDAGAFPPPSADRRARPPEQQIQS